MHDSSRDTEQFYETLKGQDADLGDVLDKIIHKHDKCQEKYLAPKKELNRRESLRVFLKAERG